MDLEDRLLLLTLEQDQEIQMIVDQREDHLERMVFFSAMQAGCTPLLSLDITKRFIKTFDEQEPGF